MIPRPLSPGPELLELRRRVVSSIRAFLDDLGYLEVETPCLVPATVPETHVDLFRVEGDLLLQASPEPQMKRLLGRGMSRIYQLSKAFRAGERGPWHNPEFTMLEWYCAGAGWLEMARQAASLVGRAFESASRPAPAFREIAVDDAFASFAGWRPSLEWDEQRFFRDMVDLVEPALRREGGVILHSWPAPTASLSRLSPSDPKVCERFELYLGGIELANGFGELTHASEQLARLEQANTERLRDGRPAYGIDSRFIESLESGLPDCSGVALGVDRLAALAAGLGGIAGVMTFPFDSL